MRKQDISKRCTNANLIPHPGWKEYKGYSSESESMKKTTKDPGNEANYLIMSFTVDTLPCQKSEFLITHLCELL